MFSTKHVSGWMFRIAWLQFSCLLVTLWYDGNKGNVGISISGQQRQGSTCADWQGNKWAERRPMPSAWKRLLHIIKEAMRRFWSCLFLSKISIIWWKPFRWCAIFLIFRLREKCRKIYIIGTGLAVYGENGRNWINSRPRPDKKFTENFQTNLWKQQNREFGGRIGNFRDWSV